MQVSIVSSLTKRRVTGEGALSINSESDRAASLVIGPTSLGMVRIYVEAEGIELPMDFEPDEALEIAEELRAAAERAMAMAAASNHPGQAANHSAGKGANRGAKGAAKDGGGGGQG